MLTRRENESEEKREKRGRKGFSEAACWKELKGKASSKNKEKGDAKRKRGVERPKKTMCERKLDREKASCSQSCSPTFRVQSDFFAVAQG